MLYYIPFSELDRGNLFHFHPQYDVAGIESGVQCIKTGSDTFQVFGIEIRRLNTFKLNAADLHSTKVGIEFSSVNAFSKVKL